MWVKIEIVGKFPWWNLNLYLGVKGVRKTEQVNSNNVEFEFILRINFVFVKKMYFKTIRSHNIENK